MKTINSFSLLLIISAMLFVPFKASAQVTIGGVALPQQGATLDLNSTFTGGLLLPNVEITDLGKIPATFTHVSVQNADVVLELAGLVVYNINLDAAANIFPGVYVWDGNDWQLLALDGGMMSINFDTSVSLACEDADGTGPITISNPSLDIAGEYTFSLIAGDENAFVDVIDAEQGIFSMRFQTNPTANVRRAILLVTDPAGRTATFIFTQEGCPCANEVDITAVGTVGTATLCANGSVHAFVSAVSSGSVTDHTFFWLRNGVLVAEGAGVELRQAGIYTVYANMVGCGTPGIITVTASDDTAQRVPHIIVDNNGILCGTNTVTFSVLNPPSISTGLVWLRDGLEQGRDVASLAVSGAANEGVWTLVYTTPDGCSSVSSNSINLIFTDGVAGLPVPQATINGVSISSGGTTICAGGTLELTITNASDYDAFTNVQYEWFANGVSLGTTLLHTMFVVPPYATDLIISVTVTATGQCPMSAISPNFTVTQGATPPATSINRGESRAYICATHPAVLTVGVSELYTFQWFRNGVEISGETGSTLSATQVGTYTVRYSNIAGCWSTVSPPIEVVQSAPVTISWLLPPAFEEIFETSRTYSVVVAPDAGSIVWSVVNSAHAPYINITPLGAGNAATVTFLESSTQLDDVVIRVEATNACGTAELLSNPFVVREGCVPAGSVVITPSTAQTMQEGQTINFTVQANTGTDNAAYPMNYTWFVNDAVVQTGTSTTFAFTQNTMGEYRIRVEALNNCNNVSAATSSPVTVNVTIDPTTRPLAPIAAQAHFTTGKTCLDAHVTGGAATDNPWMDGGRLPLSMRPNDFNNGNQLVFTYNFSTVGGSNIRFIVDDPQNIIASISGDANAATATAMVTFVPNIRELAAGSTRNTALSFRLFAVFNSGGNEVQQNITIVVQDQSCGCPARVGPNSWRMFQCHNPGANTNIDPFTGTRAQLRGNYYAWGLGDPIVGPNLATLRPVPPAADRARRATWTTWEDPCEPGWRVAEEAIWSAVFNNNTQTRPVSGQFLQLGDYLRLPAQGFRNAAGSTFFDGTRVDYWTRTPSSSTAGVNFWRHAASTAGWSTWRGSINKNYQEPVRCVQMGNPFAEND